MFVFGVADSKYFVLSFSRTHPSTKIVLRNASFLVEESQGKPWCLWGNSQVRNARRTSGKFAPTGDIHRWNWRRRDQRSHRGHLLRSLTWLKPQPYRPLEQYLKTAQPIRGYLRSQISSNGLAINDPWKLHSAEPTNKATEALFEHSKWGTRERRTKWKQLLQHQNKS